MLRESHHREPRKDVFPRFSPTWLRLLLTDLKDNIHSEKIARATFKEGERTPELTEKVVPPDVQQAILDAARELPVDVEHAMTYIVGKKEDGTLHPHRIVIVRGEKDVRAYYLDPEDHVGIETKKKATVKTTAIANVIRARVVNMMSMQLPLDGTDPRVAAIRYQTKGLPHADNLEVQLRVAKDLLHFNEVPTALQGIEKNVTTLVYVGPEGTFIQDRNSSDIELADAIAGGGGSNWLEDRLQSGRISLRRTVQHLESKPLLPRVNDTSFSTSTQ